MSIFKRTKTSPDKNTKESKYNKDKKEKKSKSPNVIKKTKIGFRSKKKEKLKKDTSQQSKKEDEKSAEIEQEGFEIENTDTLEQKSEINTNEIEALPDEIIGDKETDTSKKETQWTSTKKKKKRFITTDMKGKPVFLEDTGEKLGTVFDMILDGGKKIVGYKIKDQKSDHAPWVFTMSREGVVDAAPVNLTGIDEVNDLEAVASVGNDIYYFCSSQNISKLGKRPTNREYLIKVKRENSGLKVLDKIDLLSLIENNYSPAEQAQLGLIGKEKDGRPVLNIEGMAWHDNILYFGLKEPSQSIQLP